MKRLILSFIIFLTTCILFTSCQLIKKIRAPKKVEKEIVEKTFRKDGLFFLYPDDWTISKDIVSEKNVRRVVILDDYTSICRISVFPLKTDINLKSYAEKTDKNLRENMPIMDASKGEIEDITREFQGKNFDGVRLHRLISLFGTKVSHTTDFFLAQNKKYKVVISIEAVNEEWKIADKEFQLILDSLNFEN